MFGGSRSRSWAIRTGGRIQIGRAHGLFPSPTLFRSVSALTSLTPAAIHNWHKQVRDHVRRIALEIMGDPDGGAYTDRKSTRPLSLPDALPICVCPDLAHPGCDPQLAQAAPRSCSEDRARDHGRSGRGVVYRSEEHTASFPPRRSSDLCLP